MVYGQSAGRGANACLNSGIFTVIEVDVRVVVRGVAFQVICKIYC